MDFIGIVNACLCVLIFCVIIVQYAQVKSISSLFNELDFIATHEEKQKMDKLNTVQAKIDNLVNAKVAQQEALTQFYDVAS